MTPIDLNFKSFRRYRNSHGFFNLSNRFGKKSSRFLWQSSLGCFINSSICDNKKLFSVNFSYQSDVLTLWKRFNAVGRQMEVSSCSDTSDGSSHTSGHSCSCAAVAVNFFKRRTLMAGENCANWFSMKIVDSFVSTLTRNVDSAVWLRAAKIREEIGLTNWFAEPKSSTIGVNDLFFKKNLFKK